LDFDAAFERYVRLDKHGGITICRRANEREEVVARLPAQGKPVFGGPWMSPDGHYLAFGDSGVFGGGGGGGVPVWVVSGAAPPMAVVVGEGMHAWAFAYRQDRRQIAVGHANGFVSVYDLDSGARVRRLGLGTAPRHLAFHPNAGRLAVATGNVVRLFNVDVGK